MSESSMAHRKEVGDMIAKGTIHMHVCSNKLGSSMAHRKEVGDMIAKGAIVGVLLHSHDLNGVVAQLANAGQHGHAEVQVAVHTRLLARHANVALVDA